MKERPAIFNTPMVQAILDGRKTQTRRPIKPQPSEGSYPRKRQMKSGIDVWMEFVDLPDSERFFGGGVDKWKCPFGQVGDRLWVRETWKYGHDENPFIYYADGWDTDHKWKPSIHMPREASRILLEITDVRVERLNDISERDAKAEGLKCYTDGLYHYYTHKNIPSDQNISGYGSAKEAFTPLWDSIYSETFPSDKNPWVWVVEFKVVEVKK